MGAAKLALMVGVPLLVIGGGAAIAYAATTPSPKPEGEGAPGTSGGADPNALALAAMKTGDPGQIDLAARTLQGSGARDHAGALKATGTFIQESVLQLPADVSGMIVAAIKTGNGVTCSTTAREIKPRYPVAAVNLETVGRVIVWLQSGAPGAAPLIPPDQLTSGAITSTATAGGDANSKSLDALKSGSAATMAATAIELGSSGALNQADALRRTSLFLTESVLELPADVNGMVVAAIKTGNPAVCKSTAGAMRTKYPDAASNLENVGAIMTWLQSGAIGTPPVSVTPVTTTLATSTSAPAPIPVATTGATPDAAMIERIAKVLASGDITAMKTLAAELELRGMTLQAQQLRKIIATLELAQQQAVATTGSPAQAPVVIAPTTTAPTIPVAAAPAAVATPTPIQPTQDPGANLAARIQLHVGTTKKGSEDKAFIGTFQTAERIIPANGTYGVTTARVLGDKYGFVPPNPFYWGDTSLKGTAQYNSWKNDISSYKRWLNEKKASDSARASEWDARLKAMPKGT